jgi:hypothetical protein
MSIAPPPDPLANRWLILVPSGRTETWPGYVPEGVGVPFSVSVP